MSHAEHEWAKEQIAAHLAGGLPAEERARLEAHVAECAECIAEMDASRRFERHLDDLFAPVRPKAGLEGRMIRALRAEPARRARPFVARAGLAVAATVLLGLVGYVVLSVHQTTETVALDKFVKEVNWHYQTQQIKNAEVIADYPGVDIATDGVALETPSDMAKKRSGGGPGFPSPPLWNDTSRITLESAGEMARRASLKELAKLSRPEGLVYRKEAEADHNETADEEEFKKAKGDSLDFMSDKPGGGGRTGTRMGGKVGPPAGDKPTTRRENAQSGAYYSFKSSAPADGRGYFALPGDAAPADHARAEEVLKQLESKVDAYQGKLANVLNEAPTRRPVLPKPEAKPDPKATQPQGNQQQDQPAPAVQRKIIRSGDMEFEIETFDTAVATVTKIAGEEQGFVATVNSEKLPNGKVRGTVVVRCPPDRLDNLLLKLRALGDLKSQRIGSQDVTKHYTDLESRLRADRAMEERLLKIIKEGKGEIKDLLQAEKQLGEYREKIEVLEGEIRYYNNLIAHSTLTITLFEKEIRSPFGVTETERVTMGVEVEDVEKAYKEAVAAVTEAKGRITHSELKQTGPGRQQALLRFEVDPERSGALRDRLKQLGVVARQDVNIHSQTEGGSGRAQEIKVKRNDTQFDLSIYNLANVQPREVVHVKIAAADAEAAFKAILARAEKAGAQVLSSNLNRQRAEQTQGTITFDVKSGEADAVEVDVKAQGETLSLQRVENPDVHNSTRSKKRYVCEVWALGAVQPRETTTIQLASKDVAKAYRDLLEAVKKAEGRILAAHLNETDRRNVTATLEFDVRREHETAVTAEMKRAGEMISRSSTRAQDVENVVDTKTRLSLTLVNVANIPARETVRLGVEVGNVDRAVAALEALGRVVDAHHTREASGRHVSRVVLTVPFTSVRTVEASIKALGTVRVAEATKNPQVPEGELAIARLDVTISNEVLISADSGPWANIRKGLSVSAYAGSLALMVIMIGICFVLPLAVVVWFGIRVYRRTRAKPSAPAV